MANKANNSLQEQHQATLANIQATLHEIAARITTIERRCTKPKVVIPPFMGKEDPNDYYEWESKVDLFFSNYPYPKKEQVAKVTCEFYDYAQVWWNQARYRRIHSWDALKNIMREHFVPTQYIRRLEQRLRRLIQGSRSIEEYYQEMMILFDRAEIYAMKDEILDQFLWGLNDNIYDVLKFQYYDDLS